MYNQTHFFETISKQTNIALEILVNYSTETEQFRASFKDWLLEEHLVSEDLYLSILEQLLKIPILKEIHLSDQEMIERMLKNIPDQYLTNNKCIPVSCHNNKIQLAISDFHNFNFIKEIEQYFHLESELYLAKERNIIHAIQDVYNRGDTTSQQAEEVFGKNSEFVDVDEFNFDDSENVLSSGDDEPIRKLMNTIIYRAVRNTASDIHIDPTAEKTFFRYRVDGILINSAEVPKQGHRPLINRVKVMSKLDISTKNVPQDGRMNIELAGQKIDIRTSILPTVHGERAVLRLLHHSHGIAPLEEIGLNTEQLKQIKDIIQQINGIILVTGPTGSGKSTTLYSILQQVDTNKFNVVTIEDPVEYQVSGYGQMQVNEKIDLTFAKGLRSILRQDPDIIMVGEIRDKETAQIATQASLTGHQVFSTLHTNDAPSTLVRLQDMGIPHYLISSTVRAIIAQRLVRKLCNTCKVEKEISWKELSLLGAAEEHKKKFNGKIYTPHGCMDCNHTGYLGRIGVFELLVINDIIQEAINHDLSSRKVYKKAFESGFKPIKFDIFHKIITGVTTIEEMLRTVHTQEENAIEELTLDSE